MHEVLVNRLGGLSLPRKSVVRLTDRPDMTLDVYRGRKATIQHNPTLLCIKLEPTGVLFARTCEGDVSKVNLSVFENSWFSKSHFVDVFFTL